MVTIVIDARMYPDSIGLRLQDAEEESDVGIGRQSGSSLESVPKLQFLYIQVLSHLRV